MGFVSLCLYVHSLKSSTSECFQNNSSVTLAYRSDVRIYTCFDKHNNRANAASGSGF